MCESSFNIEAGFFVRVPYITGMIIILNALRRGLDVPNKYVLLLFLFIIIAAVSIFANIDLVGMTKQKAARATFLRPVIQLIQLSVLVLVLCSTVTLLKKYNCFKTFIMVMHWVSFSVALYAVYEILSRYLHLPFINLNNDLDSYWYLGNFFPRPRSTFMEPINMNNFQFFGIACSLIYKELYQQNNIKIWLIILIQLVVLVSSFSRSTLLILSVLLPMTIIFYPRDKARTMGQYFIRKLGPMEQFKRDNKW